MGNVKRGIVWSTRLISLNIGNIILTTWITFFATRTLGLDIGAVGMMLLLSKVFDGITDFIAGFIIDRTKTRWGVARPYDLCIIGYWVFLFLIFCTPAWGANAKMVYIFIMYFFCASVFSTFLSCADPIYLNNSMPENGNRITVLSTASTISGLTMFVVTILFPTLVSRFCETQQGWMIMMAILAVPLTFIGMVRFFFIKERVNAGIHKEKYSFAEGCRSVLHNKYILILSGSLLLCNIANTVISTATPFFFENYMNNLSYGSVYALSGISALLLVAISSVLCSKIGATNFVRMTLVIGTIGYFVRLAAPMNMTCQFVGGLLINFAPMPFWAITPHFLIECIDYGEWKNKIRVEGVVSSLNGICSKLGMGIGTALPTILLGAVGFDATKGNEQTLSATNMILGINTYVPAILIGISAIIMFFYTLEKKLPKMQEEVKLRCERKQEEQYEK